MISAQEARGLLPLDMAGELKKLEKLICVVSRSNRTSVAIDSGIWGKPSNADDSKLWTMCVSVLVQQGYRVDYDAQNFITRISWEK